MDERNRHQKTDLSKRQSKVGFLRFQDFDLDKFTYEWSPTYSGIPTVNPDTLECFKRPRGAPVLKNSQKTDLFKRLHKVGFLRYQDVHADKFTNEWSLTCSGIPTEIADTLGH